MDWIEEFYARQEELSGVYTRQIDEADREKASTLAELAGKTSKRVLELGAGGGQTAAATADLGYEVTAVELVEGAARHAEGLASISCQGSLQVIQGNFYEVELPGQYDIVSYWDGFGVGSDDDQLTLLKRIAGWLAPGGIVLIDVNTPWYWAKVAGRTMDFGKSQRRYGFDAENCRMLDSWWPKDDESQTVTQTLRCYSPGDLRLLMRDSGLSLKEIRPGGMVDYENNQYIKAAPLGQAMQYLAIIRHTTG